MTDITATDAKNRFGQVLEMARTGPVHVQKNGRDVAVVLSPEEYAALKAIGETPKVRPMVESLLTRSIERHAPLYRALAK